MSHPIDQTLRIVGPERAERPARVLVVDDEHAITAVVAKRLRRDGVECDVAHSGEEAIRCLDAAAFDAVLTDVRMPGMSGLELMREVKARDPLVQVIIMTAHAEVETAVQALRLDADDYLLKPFDLEQLAHSVRRTLEHRRLMLENWAYRRNLEERVREQGRRLERLYLAGIRALVTALEAKDGHTRGHSERVTRYALAIGHALGEVDLQALALGSRLHDIGKIGTRDDVLRKPGPLTPEEAGHIRQHPVIGVRILTPILDDAVVLGIVRHHHERWDGGGYPDGIAGERVPLPARIVCVADALDAITSPRAYRPARTWGAALEEIAAHGATQFDPRVVDATLATLREPPRPVAAQ